MVTKNGDGTVTMKLSNETYNEIMSLIDWDYGYSEDVIRELASDEVSWLLVSGSSRLSEDFIREFSDKVDWGMISTYQVLSEDFIREFSDKVDMFALTSDIGCRRLSEDFIREFSDMVNWTNISQLKLLSEDFIREFSDKVHWGMISRYQKLSKELIREFKNEVNWYTLLKYNSTTMNWFAEDSVISNLKNKLDTLSAYYNKDEYAEIIEILNKRCVEMCD